MWLGHPIEHLVCKGGELEHHKALPSPATKNRALGVLCSRARGRYRQLIGPGSCHEPGLKGSLWSRFMPPTGTNDGGPGASPIGPGSSHQPGPKGPDEPGPMRLAPGPPPVVPVGGVNRDQRLPFCPGSWHEPGPTSCLYLPLAREQSTPSALFFVAGEGRALWCSSSPPMHMRCSMECPSHTT